MADQTHRPLPASGGDLAASVLSPLLKSGIEDHREALGQHLFIAQLNWEALEAASFRKSGEMCTATSGFPLIDPAQVQDWSPLPGALSPVRLPQDEAGAGMLLAVAGVTDILRWSFPHKIKTLASAAGANIVAILVSAAAAPNALVWACARLGLTGLQMRILSELLHCGDLRIAAVRAQMSYTTAREAVADAMERAGVKKRSQLIDQIASLAFGLTPSGIDARHALADVWGLSSRQARLCLSLAQGATRMEAATAARLSDAVVKKELARAFEILGVANASAIPVRIAEANTFAGLVQMSGEDMQTGFDGAEPLKLVTREAGAGRIAFSDYGPRSGKPVLILHSSLSARSAPSRLVQLLQSAGYRPFSIDRPGFGLSDPIEDQGDPFALACGDIRTCMHALRLERIDIIARGGAQVAAHFASQSPECVGRVVLVAPDPSTRTSKSLGGILGASKRAVQANPHMLEAFARLFISNLRRLEMRDLISRSVGSSPPDLAIMQDPSNLADYARGYRPFLAGRIKGYVREQSALATLPDPPSPATTASWTILIGAHDPLHDPEESSAYWRGIAPDAAVIRLEDAGRFIAWSHPERIVSALLGS